MTQTPTAYPFGGGLNTSSPALMMPPGMLLSGMNYEPLAEGYGRVEGYERFDGQTAPSATHYWTLGFDGGVYAINSGVQVIGATSGATGMVVLDPVGLTGSWDAGTAAGTLILADVIGTFADNEVLKVGGVPRAFANGIATEDTPDTETNREAWKLAAQEWRRALILKVPGSGPVRGVAELNGTIYTWRDNEAGTRCDMWKSSLTGWQAVAMPKRIGFSAGLVAINDGDVIVGQTSGATATVARIARTSGNWGSTASGNIVASVVTGSFVPGETIKVGAVAVATSGTQSDVMIPPGGRFNTFTHNFYGGAATLRMYGANGVGRGFEFDGTTYVPIETGTDAALDKPKFCFEIAQGLGFCFTQGSVQISRPGEPLIWSIPEGASEFGFGSEITDVVQAVSTAVAIFGKQRIATLSGTDANTFTLHELTEEAGADPYTAQRVGTTIYLDRRGLRTLAATQDYGNFKTGAISQAFEKYFRSKRAAGAVPVASIVGRSKSHYRLFWDDGTGLAVYVGPKRYDAIPFALGPGIVPSCTITCEMADGTEGLFFGASDGFVYRLDSGTSYDGAGIRGFVMTPFIHLGNARQEKRFHGVSLELQAPPRARIGITGQYNYGDGDRPISGSKQFTVLGTGGNDFLVQGGGGSWDQTTWDEFFWSSPVEGIAYADLDGIGRNVSLIFACDCHSTEIAHVLQTYIVFHSPRRMVTDR